MSIALAAAPALSLKRTTRPVPTPSPMGRLAIRSGRHTLQVAHADIRWVQAARNYLRIYTGPDYHLLRQTMSNIVAELDPHQFVRIHRCTLVNRDWIEEVRHLENGQSLVILKDQTVLRMSRGFRHVLNHLSRLATPVADNVSWTWR